MRSRNVVKLAPWGRPPTPLLPSWYRETLCYLRLPIKIRKANPALKTVGELSSFWEGVQSQVDKTFLHSLVKLVRAHRPPPNYIVIPAGIDSLELSHYPLRPRTANIIQCVIQREDLLNENKGLSVGELLSFRNFGLVSLLDLMCVTELALSDNVMKGTRLKIDENFSKKQEEHTRKQLDKTPWIGSVARPRGRGAEHTGKQLDKKPVRLRNVAQIAPWGSPPTPLLPSWYRQNLPNFPLPRSIQKINPKTKTVGELGAFWEGVKTPIDKVSLQMLVSLVRNHRPHPNYVVIPSGINPIALSRFPLQKRTSNLFKLEDNVSKLEDLLKDDKGLTVGELMAFKNFGLVSLLDLMCVAELALSERVLKGTYLNINETNPEKPAEHTKDWDIMVDLIGTLLSAANEFHGVASVRDALELDLANLAAIIGIAQDLDSIRIRNLTHVRRIATTITEGLGVILGSLTSREQLILKRRLLANSPNTLQELGKQIGVTRERIRQIELGVLDSIENAVGPEISIATSLLNERLGPVTSVTKIEKLIADFFDSLSTNQTEIDLANCLIKSRLNYSCVQGICFNEAAISAIKILGDTATKLADDVGLIDKKTLQDHLPDEKWGSFFPQLVQGCRLHRIGDRLALRDTIKARVKAAILKIGRAATKEEIETVCGLDSDQIRGPLSGIPTVVRMDKTRWGLVEWTDDVYEGISTEIIQRVNEDGGATPLRRLLEELPNQFRVSKSSVRAYVGTPKFTLSDGYVSLAHESSISFRNLEDVIDGRTVSGNPYWTFPVRNRYFDGYSLTGFPPELARELGCEPNGKTKALVANLEGPKGIKISIVWSVASLAGVTLGYLAEPLQKLGVRKGDRIRLVIKSPGVVELHRENPARFDESNSVGQAETILNRLKNRRKVI